MAMRFVYWLTFAALALASAAFGGRLPTTAAEAPASGRATEWTRPEGIEQIREERRFGVGASIGGGLGVFGFEADVNINDWLSITGGYGAGIDFSSWTVKARALLPGAWVAPYAAFGVGRWWTSATGESRPGPGLLADRLLGPGEDAANGFDAYLAYPAVGVQWMLPSAFAFYAEMQCLFRLFTLRHAFYLGAGAHMYF